MEPVVGIWGEFKVFATLASGPTSLDGGAMFHRKIYLTVDGSARNARTHKADRRLTTRERVWRAVAAQHTCTPMYVNLQKTVFA